MKFTFMRSRLFLLSLLACFQISVESSLATVIFTSPGGEIGTTSTGTSFNDEGLTFALGAFSSGFTPTTANEALWESNFIAVQTTTWIDDTTGTTKTGYYQGASDTDFTTLGVSEGQQAYVWIYNTKTIGSGTEWMLLTNITSWKFPSGTVGIPPVFDTSNTGTYAILGFLGVDSVGADPYLQTVSVVPEPTSVALLATGGLFVTGAMLRRRRKVA